MYMNVLNPICNECMYNEFLLNIWSFWIQNYKNKIYTDFFF